MVGIVCDVGSFEAFTAFTPFDPFDGFGAERAEHAEQGARGLFWFFAVLAPRIFKLGFASIFHLIRTSHLKQGCAGKRGKDDFITHDLTDKQVA